MSIEPEASFTDAARAPERAAAPDRSVRPALPGDAPAIGRIQAAALRAAFGAGVEVEGAELATHWEKTLSAPAPAGCSTLVALHASQVAGFALVVPAHALDLPGERRIEAGAEIAELLVDPDFVRCGHASRLLQAIADTCGAPTLRAWARPDDEARTRLLESVGFAPAGIRRSFEAGGPVLVEHLWWAAIQD